MAGGELLDDSFPSCTRDGGLVRGGREPAVTLALRLRGMSVAAEIHRRIRLPSRSREPTNQGTVTHKVQGNHTENCLERPVYSL